MMIQKLRRRNEEGLTLIELMVVIAIIGILALIAIPNFIEYRMRSHLPISDVQNAHTVAEAYFIDNDPYTELDVVVPPPFLGYKPSKDVTITITGNYESLIITGTHPLCDGKICRYSNGKIKCDWPENF